MSRAGAQRVDRCRHRAHRPGRGRGDLYIHVTIDVPTQLDDVERELLEKLAAHRNEAVHEPEHGLFRKRKK